MIQQALFPKATRFRRPRKVTNRWGDVYRIWPLSDGTGKVVETRSICTVAIKRTFKAVIVDAAGECLVSVHRKLRPALAAVVKATEPKPTSKKRKVRR